MPQPVVVHQFCKQFRSLGVNVLAVDHLSFSVHAGEVYGLLGPNGAGKTTTLRMIVGLLAPDHGYAEVAGFRTSQAPQEVKARIGLVSANDGVYPWLTVREMLRFFGDLYGVDPRPTDERIDRLSRLLDFTEYLDRRCVELSTGQKQRITLARALVHAPPVLLMDEPTRGLDVVGSKTVFDFISHAREQQLAIIVSTHRLDEAQRLCDRFGLVHRGRLAHEGSLEQLQRATGRSSLVQMFEDLLEAPANA
jgi:ABC-2 type transport system ATP-binding protein/sodium transport system ATP-binding protein